MNGKKRIPVATFNEDTLEFVDYSKSVLEIANKIGRKNKNANILKYLKGEINHLYGYVFVQVEKVDEVTPELILRWKTQADIRKKRAEITHITAAEAKQMEPYEVSAIYSIIKKYKQ